MEFEKVWSDEQCPNIGIRSGITLEECQRDCGQDGFCTAINYSPTVTDGSCVLRKCGNEVPLPAETYGSGYKGYGYPHLLRVTVS